MLGYGGSQKPIEASEYSAKKICADLAALLDLLEIKSAVCDMKVTVHDDSMLIIFPGNYWT